MSEAAYDIREERPVYTELDPIRTPEALLYGLQICQSCDYDRAGLTDVIWTLFVEAARTERAIVRPGPAGFNSGYPAIIHLPSEIFEARLERLKDKMPEYENTAPRIQPTAAQFSRYEEVSRWLRFCHYPDKKKAMRVLWFRAQNKPYPWISEHEGWKIGMIRKVKSQQLAIIAGRIKDALPELANVFSA